MSFWAAQDTLQVRCRLPQRGILHPGQHCAFEPAALLNMMALRRVSCLPTLFVTRSHAVSPQLLSSACCGQTSLKTARTCAKHVLVKLTVLGVVPAKGCCRKDRELRLLLFPSNRPQVSCSKGVYCVVRKAPGWLTTVLPMTARGRFEAISRHAVHAGSPVRHDPGKLFQRCPLCGTQGANMADNDAGHDSTQPLTIPKRSHQKKPRIGERRGAHVGSPQLPLSKSVESAAATEGFFGRGCMCAFSGACRTPPGGASFAALAEALHVPVCSVDTLDLVMWCGCLS